MEVELEYLFVISSHIEYDQNNTILNLDSQFPFFFHYLSFFMIVMKNEIKLRVYIRIFMANCKVTTDIVI